MIYCVLGALTYELVKLSFSFVIETTIISIFKSWTYWFIRLLLLFLNAYAVSSVNINDAYIFNFILSFIFQMVFKDSKEIRFLITDNNICDRKINENPDLRLIKHDRKKGK